MTQGIHAPTMRESLLNVAAKQFALRGISASNLKDIAREVGVSAPAVYNHFDSKEQLAFEAFHWAMSEFSKYVASVTTSADPAIRLAEMIRGHVKFKLARSDVASAYVSVLGNRSQLLGLTSDHVEELRELERRYYMSLRSVVDDGIKNGTFTVAASSVPVFAIISMCESVYTWFQPGGTLKLDEVAAEFVEYSLRIVGAEDGTRETVRAWLRSNPAPLPPTPTS